MQKLSNQISDLRELEKLSTNLSKDISVGDIYLFKGELGAGKTTFLKILSGQEEATEGEVQIQNGKKVGVLSQN